MASDQLMLPVRERPPRGRTTTPPRYTVATYDNKLVTLPVPRQIWGYEPAKRALDVCASAVALLVLTPLFVVVAALIKLTSPGPVFFRSQRVGEGGHIFTMFKFRSMRSDADPKLHKKMYLDFLQGHGGNGKVTHEYLEGTGADPAKEVTAKPGVMRRALAWFRSEDPRVTSIGAIIRGASIDELPQLFNVLRGEMSLVGPRPPIPFEVRHYQPEHLSRLAVCPGLTGVWQVHGRNRVAFEIMVYMDMWYIDNRSFYLDLKLILRTIPSIIMARSH
jgi:lipopolysaccharide/colanic/teichoic acid biosynthesis glycosyltransferase